MFEDAQIQYPEADPTKGNRAAQLQDVNAAEGNQLAQATTTPSGRPSFRQALGSALFNPYNNMQNNWSQLTSDFGQGTASGFGHGLIDAYAMTKNPTGDWGRTQNQAQSSQKPNWAEGDLGPVNAHGNRPITAQGYSKLSPTDSVSDNSSMTQAKSSAIPTADNLKAQSGFFGRLAHGIVNSAINLGTAGTVQSNWGSHDPQGSLHVGNVMPMDNSIGSPKATGQSPFQQMNQRDAVNNPLKFPTNRQGVPDYTQFQPY